MNECRICGTSDSDKPMVFRNEVWCCDDHRKLVVKIDKLSVEAVSPRTKELLKEV